MIWDSTIWIDLDSDHFLRWNTNRTEDGFPFTGTVKHKNSGQCNVCTGDCQSGILLENCPPKFREKYGGGLHNVWQIESWEPLTLSPSLLCHCGDHGFIRGGRWVQ